MVCEVLTGLSTLPRSLHRLGSAVLDGLLWGCGGKFSHFSLLRLPSHEDGDIDEGELMRCSSYPQNAKSSPLPDRNESIAVYCCNRFKKPSCMPLTRVQQTSINWTSPKSKSKKKMLANPFERSEPTEPPLWTSRTTGFTSRKSDLETKNLFAKKAVHTNFRVDIREHAPFFSHLVPGLIRKLQFSFCKTSLITVDFRCFTTSRQKDSEKATCVRKPQTIIPKFS